ncbi:MAG: hydrogenase 1 maturation protease [bacterium]|jgi:hydrogenase maturation protease|nr:MAG: hydrogenase 1 maturation protease [bacterium]KAF0149072.1 MAG: hydrogenase 1 maturation protease [bacterium]KAF0168436.1 MAG: hydrogenase 1 maturation protease [bacterium]TXT20815.1 MAG: hydrogenase 1 maturation protease [bacterium]
MCEVFFMAMKTLVLGIGNTLLSDEGVGIHVLQALSAGAPLPEDVELMDGGTLSFTLAGPIEEADALIVVDAAHIKAEPGAWRLFEGEAMDAFLLGNRKSSVHEVGLTDLRAIAILAGHWPEKRALLAIQPQVVDWGEAPTPAVAEAIPPVCAAIRGLIEGWRHVA